MVKSVHRVRSSGMGLFDRLALGLQKTLAGNPPRSTVTPATPAFLLPGISTAPRRTPNGVTDLPARINRPAVQPQSSGSGNQIPPTIPPGSYGGFGTSDIRYGGTSGTSLPTLNKGQTTSGVSTANANNRGRQTLSNDPTSRTLPTTNRQTPPPAPDNSGNAWFNAIRATQPQGTYYDPTAQNKPFSMENTAPQTGPLQYSDLIAQAGLKQCDPHDVNCTANNAARSAAVQDFWVNSGYIKTGAPAGLKLSFDNLNASQVQDDLNNKVDTGGILHAIIG